MSKFKIFYAYHNDQIPKIELDYLIPIQSGTDLADHKFENCIHDNDSSDNISKKNDLFAELCVQYYVYKNFDYDDEEIVGLFQQKRMLIDNFLINDKETIQFINAPGNPTNFIRMNLTEENKNSLKNIILKDNYTFDYYDIITRHTTFWLPLIPVRYYWNVNNTKKIMDLCIEAIDKIYPEYKRPFEDMLNYTNLNVMDNLFVTKWKWFKAYSKWLFDILFYIDDHMTENDFDELKSMRKSFFERKIADKFVYKSYAWLAEHLFIVWLLKHRLVRIEKWIAEFH